MLQFNPRLSTSLDFMESVPNSLQIIVLAQKVLIGIIIMEGCTCVMVDLTLRKDLAGIFGRQLENLLLLLSAHWNW